MASDREEAAAEAGAAPKATRTGAEEAAALDKVTDRVEEKEIKAQVDSSRVREAMAKLAETEKAAQEARRARERELAAVKVQQADVDLICREFELDKRRAETKLRECGGDVKAALTALLEA
eukprot:scaffold3.g6470.t1